MTIGTLANWRSKGRGPKFLKVGRKVLYRNLDIDKFEKSNLMNKV